MSTPSHHTTIHSNRALFELDASPSDSSDKTNTYALIVLNTPLTPDSLLFRVIWPRATVRVLADGGSNRVYDALPEDTRPKYLPDAICGDLDSARDEVLAYYAHLDVPVVRDGDQDTTDLQKCGALLSRSREAGGLLERVQDVRTLVIFGGFGGRLDQEMSCLHALFLLRDDERFERVVLVSDGNCAELLQPGHHTIHCARSHEGPVCGLIPIGEPCKSVTTTGLQWNLSGDPLRFGGLISSSNRFDKDAQATITVECTHPLLWTTHRDN